MKYSKYQVVTFKNKSDKPHNPWANNPHDLIDYVLEEDYGDEFEIVIEGFTYTERDVLSEFQLNSL